MLGLGTIAQGVVGLGSAVAGAITKRKADKEMKGLLKDRPVYEVQAEYGQNKALAENVRNMYANLTKSSKTPGQQYAEQQLDQNTANTLASASRSGVTNPALLAQMSSSALQSQNQGVNQLNIEGARQRQDNYGNLANATQGVQSANTALAEEKDKAWNYNVNEAYQNRVDAARKKQQFGTELIQKGADMFGGTFSQIGRK